MSHPILKFISSLSHCHTQSCQVQHLFLVTLNPAEPSSLLYHTQSCQTHHLFPVTSNLAKPSISFLSHLILPNYHLFPVTSNPARPSIPSVTPNLVIHCPIQLSFTDSHLGGIVGLVRGLGELWESILKVSQHLPVAHHLTVIPPGTHFTSARRNRGQKT